MTTEELQLALEGSQLEIDALNDKVKRLTWENYQLEQKARLGELVDWPLSELKSLVVKLTERNRASGNAMTDKLEKTLNELMENFSEIMREKKKEIYETRN